MRRSRSIMLAATLVACVATVAGAASPVPGREEGGPSPAPSGPPVASPAASPSPGAPSASPGPSLVFSETFEMPSDLWWTGRDKREQSAFADGGLRIRLRGRGSNVTWQWADLPAPLDAVRVEVVVLVERGPGGGGPICGDASGDGAWYWGGINDGGEWLLGWITGSRLHVEQRGDMPVIRDPDAPVGGPIPLRITLDCAVDPDGGPDQVALAVAGEPVATMAKRRIGPYPQAGFVVAGDAAGVTVSLDDLLVWDPTGATVASSPSPVSSPVPSPATGGDVGANGSPAP